MIYQGQVRGDVIVLAQGVHLPDGTQVLIEPLTSQPSPDLTNGSNARNGVPVFPSAKGAMVPDLDLVNSLRDDAP